MLRLETALRHEAVTPAVFARGLDRPIPVLAPINLPRGLLPVDGQCVQNLRDQTVIDSFCPKLEPDPHRTHTARTAGLNQALYKAAFVLPTGGLEFGDDLAGKVISKTPSTQLP